MRRFLVVEAVVVASLLGSAAATRAVDVQEESSVAVADVATCLRTAGVDGTVVRSGRSGVVVLRATLGGLQSRGTVQLGRLSGVCPEFAESASGAAVVAGVVAVGRKLVVRAAAREPGGTFSRAQTVLAVSSSAQLSLAVGVAPSGAAIVAVGELVRTPLRGGLPTARARLRVARRAPGTRFGVPETVERWYGADAVGDQSVAAAMAGDTTATVTWAHVPAISRSAGAGPQVLAAVAAPGHRAGRPQRVALLGDGEGPALAAASDGRALLTWTSDQGVWAAERAPGAARFDAPRAIASASSAASEATAAIQGDGGAVIAWRQTQPPLGIDVAARSATGAFGPPVQVAPGPPSDSAENLITEVGGEATGPSEQRAGQLRALLSDGRYALTWADPAADPAVHQTHLALGTIAAPAPDVDVLGSRVKAVDSVAPVLSGEGARGAVWTDDDSIVFGSDVATGRGRLRLALEGAPTRPAAPAPRVLVARAARQHVFADGTVVLRAGCDRACDLRVATRAARVTPSIGRTTTLDHAGWRQFAFALLGPELRLVRNGALTVTLTASAPGGEAVNVRRVRIPVVIKHSPPTPIPRDVRAHRVGASVVVTWQTARAAVGVGFAVLGTPTPTGEPTSAAHFDGRGHRAFRITLTRATGVRYVTVSATGHGGSTANARPIRVT